MKSSTYITFTTLPHWVFLPVGLEEQMSKGSIRTKLLPLCGLLCLIYSHFQYGGSHSSYSHSLSLVEVRPLIKKENYTEISYRSLILNKELENRDKYFEKIYMKEHDFLLEKLKYK